MNLISFLFQCKFSFIFESKCVQIHRNRIDHMHFLYWSSSIRSCFCCWKVFWNSRFFNQSYLCVNVGISSTRLEHLWSKVLYLILGSWPIAYICVLSSAKDSECMIEWKKSSVSKTQVIRMTSENPHANGSIWISSKTQSKYKIKIE